MKFETYELSDAFLEHSFCPHQRGLSRAWNDSKILSDPLSLREHVPHVVIYGPPDGDLMPPILEVGDKSLAAQMMVGKNWRQEFAKYQGITKICDAYAKAFNGEPTFDHVAFSNNGVTATYERLLLPFYTPTGFPMVISHCRIVGFAGIADHPASLQNPTNEDLLARSLVLLGKDGSPNVEHLRHEEGRRSYQATLDLHQGIR